MARELGAFHAARRATSATRRQWRAPSEGGVDGVVHLAALAGVRPSLERPGRPTRTSTSPAPRVVLAEAAARTRPAPRRLRLLLLGVRRARARAPSARAIRSSVPSRPTPRPRSAAELVAHTFHHAHGLPVLCTRIFTAFGPRQRPDLAVRKFAERMLKGEPVPIYGDGSSLRDFTFVEDLVDGLVRALDSGPRLRDPEPRRRPDDLGPRRGEDARGARALGIGRHRLAAASDRRRAADLGRHRRRAPSPGILPAGLVRGGRPTLRRLAAAAIRPVTSREPASRRHVAGHCGDSLKVRMRGATRPSSPAGEKEGTS